MTFKEIKLKQYHRGEQVVDKITTARIFMCDIFSMLKIQKHSYTFNPVEHIFLFVESVVIMERDLRFEIFRPI